MVSIKDVASLAGVSWMTVSRVINTPEKVKASTLKRVNKAIVELNYVPDRTAQNMRAKASPDYREKTIGILAFEVATAPFAVEISLAIEQTCLEYGWNAMIVNVQGTEPSDQELIKLLSHRPSGIVFATMGLEEVSIPERLKDHPLVLANCFSSKDKDIPAYIPDNEQGEYNAVSLLMSKGYRNPIYITLNHKKSPAHTPRFKGAAKALKEQGINIEDLWVDELPEDDNYHYVTEIIDKAIAHDYQFDSIICGNDRVAMLAYMYLYRLGYKIPDDVAILGFDNMVGTADLFEPGLTTVQLPHKEIGRKAALHIIDALESKEITKLNCPLVERASL